MQTDDYLNRPLFSLTIGEFIELLKREQKPAIVEGYKNDSFEKYVYGIAGIAKLFGCSKTTAQVIKSSGRIDEAITQVGRTITVDSQKALELAKKPLKIKHNYITRK